MRRLATGVLATALLLLALVAALDALRGGNAEPARSPVSTSETDSPVAALRLAGARGTITYSDEGCRLHAIRLPSLDPAAAPGYERCEPHIPSGGLAILGGEVVWSGLGFQTVQVVLSRADLAAAVRRTPEAADLAYEGAGPYEARQLVAFGRDRYGVVLVSRRAEWEPLFTIFDGRRLVRLHVRLVGLRDVVRSSPRGRYFAVVHPQGVDVYRTRGGQIRLPSVTNAHAVAWSPDDRWTALATRYSVYVFPSQRPEQTIRIPLAVRELDWGT
jgi:hypothetical protein